MWVAAAAAVLLAYVAFTSNEPRPDRGADSPAVGVAPSVLQFAPLTGDPEPLDRRDLLGEVTLINYWGPWCHFCREEMPHLLELREELADRDDFRLVLVSGGPYGDVEILREETAEYFDNLDAGAPSYHDPDSQSLAALAREAKLPSIGFPTTVALDREGVIRGLWIGFRPDDAEDMEELVRGLLE